MATKAPACQPGVVGRLGSLSKLRTCSVRREGCTARSSRELVVGARCEASTSGDGAPLNVDRRIVLGAVAAASSAGTLGLGFPEDARANRVLSATWEQVDLPISNEIVLLDVGFTESNPKHGFLLGTRQTLLESFDGGKSWKKRDIQAALDEGFNYRFTRISFSGDEGWIVGKPAILLHTSDGGTNWERIPISSKLPGVPVIITALPGQKGQAEMSTDQGAIYVTNDGAFTWKAAVQETVDATLNRTLSSGISGASYYEGYFANINRSSAGDYVAVSSRGNFFMTWSPGDAYWMPHNRPVARRVQNMGWTDDNRLWLTTRGGDVYVAATPGISEDFRQTKIGSRGFGILDVGFRTKNEGYACGGSGSLFQTTDGGKSWKRDRSFDDIPANLYDISFSNSNIGFILGNNGVLLKYIA